MDSDPGFWPDVIRMTFRAFAVLMAVLVLAVAGFLLLRGLYAWYYVQTHCTEVLGTRVCQ